MKRHCQVKTLVIHFESFRVKITKKYFLGTYIQGISKKAIKVNIYMYIYIIYVYI